MYQNPHNEALLRQIESMDKKKVRNMEAIDSGAGFSGGNIFNKKYTYKELGFPPPLFTPFDEVRKIGGKKRGRPSKKLQGEGILGSIGGLVDDIFGLGKGQKKGQKRYKKQAEEMYACGGSGFASGTHMDTGFERTEGAGGSGGAKIDEKKLMELFFSKGKAKKMREKLEGEGFFGDFWDGFKKGFTGTLDIATKALPVVAPFIGLGKSGGRKTTRTDLERMGKMDPDKLGVVERSQMLGSDMSGFGRKKSKKCMCEGEGVSGGMRTDMVIKPMPDVGVSVMKMKKYGGRRTEETGDFSGMGRSGGGGSGGKKPQNAWLQLVNKVRKEQGFKGVKDAIKYIKDKKLYTKK